MNPQPRMNTDKHGWRHLPPWPLQMVSSILAATQVLLPYYATEALAAPAVEPRVVEGAKSEWPVTPQRREYPVPSPVTSFSDMPTAGEITRARVFEVPLIAMGKPPTAEENRALADAIVAYRTRAQYDDASVFEQYLAQFPTSAWRVALLTELGGVYRRAGYFTRALAAWEEAWRLGRNETAMNPAAIVDRAVSELAELNARLGRYDRLETLFKEMEGRNVRGSAAQKVVNAREGLAMMNLRPEISFMCGPMALERIRAARDPETAIRKEIRESRSPRTGFSLVEVRDLALKLEMGLEMARRSPGAKIPLPAVVHWKSGHYAALIKEHEGRFLVQDPTFGSDLWVTPAALDEEGSGYFLIPLESQKPAAEDESTPQKATKETKGSSPHEQAAEIKSLPSSFPSLPSVNSISGWQSVSAAEGATVFGKGITGFSDENRTACFDKKNCSNCQSGSGMAAYAFHLMTVNLNIIDTPVGYQPPVGPALQFRVTYNHREANRPTPFNYGNLGSLWSYDWLSYVREHGTNDNVTIHLRGGGAVPFAFVPHTGEFSVSLETQAKLVKTASPRTYVQTYPDGSKEVFEAADGGTPQKVFLTKIIDPASNTVTFAYDASFRLTNVIDAIGQTNRITYAGNDPGDISTFYRIVAVTDAFGRSASFAYNATGQLTNITDVIGLSSAFTYGSGDFITSLTTPYGTTTFAGGETNIASVQTRTGRAGWKRPTR